MKANSCLLNARDWTAIKLTGGGKFLLEEDQVHVLKADRVEGRAGDQALHPPLRPRVQSAPGGHGRPQRVTGGGGGRGGRGGGGGRVPD